jgi:hypothetical protein
MSRATKWVCILAPAFLLIGCNGAYVVPVNVPKAHLVIKSVSSKYVAAGIFDDPKECQKPHGVAMLDPGKIHELDIEAESPIALHLETLSAGGGVVSTCNGVLTFRPSRGFTYLAEVKDTGDGCAFAIVRAEKTPEGVWRKMEPVRSIYREVTNGFTKICRPLTDKELAEI